MRGPRGELGGSSVCLQSLFDVLHFRFIHNSGILDADFRCGIVSPGRFFDLPRSISQDKKSDFGIFVIKFVGLRISVYRGHFLSWFVSGVIASDTRKKTKELTPGKIFFNFFSF
jgi:hypothetical protein